MHDENRKTWNSLPAWKKAAMAKAARQNERQRAAARPARDGFNHCTTGASLSLVGL